MGRATFRGPDGSPRISLAILTTTALGTLLYHYWLAIIATIQAWGDGITDTIDGLAAFLEFDLVGGIFDIGEAGIETAWQNNEAFIQSFGILSQVVALVEVALLVWLILATFNFLLSVLRGAMS